MANNFHFWDLERDCLVKNSGCKKKISHKDRGKDKINCPCYIHISLFWDGVHPVRFPLQKYLNNIRY